MNETAFIAALRTLATDPAARGLADDAAVLAVGGETLVLTHDMLAEGVHVLPGQDMGDVAWKLVATNVSDLAAKGAEPVGALLGHMLGEDDARFLAGLSEALAAWRVPLLGGDTIKGASPACPRSFGLTAIGRATCRPVPSRAGARPGHGLWITGPVGAAMIGCEALRAGSRDEALTLAYRRPHALLAEGIALAPQVGAMMDVSDGLLLDAARMARASGITLAITAAAVPLAAPEARRRDALRWGDDYQLLFTLPPGAAPAAPAVRIGEAVSPAACPILLDGQPLSETDGLGYLHGAHENNS